MERASWIVEPDPFYAREGFCQSCKEIVGAEHGPDCGFRRRTVVARTAFEYVIEIREAGGGDFDIENNCASNVVDLLNDMADKLDAEDRCMCPFEVEAEFVREATKEDNKRFGFIWEGE